MDVFCQKCGGENTYDKCKRFDCPKWDLLKKIKIPRMNFKKDFAGSAPTVFVGRAGYPNLNVGIMAPPIQDESNSIYDDPVTWSRLQYDSAQVLTLRSSLINSRYKSNVKGTSRYTEIAKEVALAEKPVDIEFNLVKNPYPQLNFNNVATPFGPTQELINAQITANSKINPKLESIVDDVDLHAHDAMIELYRKKIDTNIVMRVLSSGLLGIEFQRKLVPTRWAITAVDDSVSKKVIEELRDFNDSGYVAFFGTYMYNSFLILFLPGLWSYELFEIYTPTKQHSTDYEGCLGRKDYAINCAGGYYAIRYSVAQKLKEMKRKASVLVFRFITDGYDVPLGVWVCREASKISLNIDPFKFSDENFLFTYAKLVVKRKFNVDLDLYLKQSNLLKERRDQSKLTKFFS